MLCGVHHPQDARRPSTAELKITFSHALIGIGNQYLNANHLFQERWPGAALLFVAQKFLRQRIGAGTLDQLFDFGHQQVGLVFF